MLICVTISKAVQCPVHKRENEQQWREMHDNQRKRTACTGAQHTQPARWQLDDMAGADMWAWVPRTAWLPESDPALYPRTVICLSPHAGCLGCQEGTAWLTDQTALHAPSYLTGPHAAAGSPLNAHRQQQHAQTHWYNSGKLDMSHGLGSTTTCTPSLGTCHMSD